MRKIQNWMMGLAAVMVGAVWAQTPSVVVVEPLCSATQSWNQTGKSGAILNAYVDLGMGYPCGCDMLAWGQIATYHGLVTGYPAAGWKPTPTTGVVELYDNSGVLINKETRTTLPGEYNWTDICDKKPAVSRLMRDLGVLGNTAYRPGATSGTLGNKGFTSYFKYEGVGYRMTLPFGDGKLLQSNWASVVEASIRGSLHAGAPLQVNITAHAIICDGYGYAEDGTLLFHLHWGWGDEGRWKSLDWFGSTDEFSSLIFNVHPQALGCVLAGRVTRGGQPVANAQVTLSNDKPPVRTNEKGAYCFTGLTAETNYTVTVTVGEETVEESFTTAKFVDDDLRGKLQDQWEAEHGKDGTRIPLETGNVVVDFELPVPVVKLYVTPNGSGDGSSWENVASLKKATFEKLANGTEVHVASGDYSVTEMTEIITVPAGVTVMGGYNSESDTRDVMNTPSVITRKKGDSLPSYIFEIKVGAVVDGFVLADNHLEEGTTVAGGGVVKNCIFTEDSFRKFAQGVTMQCCIVRNPSATQEECSLIHCTFYGEVPTGKDDKGGTVAGCLSKVTADVPEASSKGTCTCGLCPETGLDGRALEKTPGALAPIAAGYQLRLR